MSTWSKMPILFGNDRITRPYIGGRLLNEWRRECQIEDGHQCEELLVTSIGAISKGKPQGYAVSRTIKEQGEVLLTDIIKEDPIGILGKRYQHYNPNHLSVLARAGDTIVRLVLQCHPRKEDAVRYFHSAIGKTEAWYIARTREIEGEVNCVYAGFKPHVTRALWAELCKQQDIKKMVDCLHKIRVKEGDVILIPAGMPHAVGPGCVFLEIHECSDITIRVERNVNGVELSDEEMFYGLPFEKGIDLFDTSTYNEAEIIKRVVMQPKNKTRINDTTVCDMINEQDTDAFGMMIADVKKEWQLPAFDGHRLLVAIDNDVELRWQDQSILLTQGHGALIPAECEKLCLIADSARVLIGIPSNI